ncbi:hypothetical protein QFC21_001655 [Naganishia friedmannii]|uniref:Uncharacterized protein n=1 Tax=Naganishia friedmannii TaxID=89922 RepID=A0ACC2W3R5_9TREE|nr:hypothetical protein QFC21_001655 [Naganishia friedmannii]
MAEVATSPQAEARPDSRDTSAKPEENAGRPDSWRGEGEAKPTMQIQRDRRESDASQRPEAEAPPAKRQRTFGAEEKKRGQRLFGNLMGTLAKFGKEEKTRNSTEKAKKRDELANRVAMKIRSESSRVHEITGLTREIKGYRIEIERKQQEMNIREMQLKTKTRQLPKMSRFLLTSSPDWLTSAIATATVLPISYGPARDKATAEKAKPLVYLLPEQEDIIDDQIDKVNKLLDDEEDDFDDYQALTKKAIVELEEKKAVAEEKLSKYRRADEDRAAEKLGSAIPDLPAPPAIKTDVDSGDIDMQVVARASGRPPIPEREERSESRVAGEEVEW